MFQTEKTVVLLDKQFLFITEVLRTCRVLPEAIKSTPMINSLKTLILLVSIFTAFTASANQSCKALLLDYKKPSEVALANELSNALKLSQKVMTEIRKESALIQARLQKNSEIFDVVCLGAGPQCTAASMVLGKTNLKSLVVEKSDTVSSNFASKDFMINSSETSDLTMHEIPGGALHFDQIMSSKYGNSQQLATYVQALQFQSKVPVLLNTEVVSFELRKIGNIEVVVLKTAQGTEILAKKLMVGTGLGEAVTKIPDSNYQKILKEQVQISKQNPLALQKLMNTETFMKALKLDPKAAKPIVMPKTLAMIGSGDGARISLEELMESFVVMPKDFKIYWIGSNIKTADEYIASQKGWDRYIEKVVPHFQQGRIESVSGYGQSVEFLSNGKMKISVQDPDTKVISQVEVDMAVDNTGYENVILNNILKAFPQSALKDVRGSLAERNLNETALARQLSLNGQDVGIYFLGISAGPLATREELATALNRNPVAIYNNAPRTSAFVSQVTGTPSLPRTIGKKTTKNKVMDADSAFELLQAKRNSAN